jgi:hypothetical protein
LYSLRLILKQEKIKNSTEKNFCTGPKGVAESWRRTALSEKLEQDVHKTKDESPSPRDHFQGLSRGKALLSAQTGKEQGTAHISNLSRISQNREYVPRHRDITDF